MSKPALALILSAVLDFLDHLDTSNTPIVVGKDYPRERLIIEFQNWMVKHNIKIDSVDRSFWIKACELKVFQNENS